MSILTDTGPPPGTQPHPAHLVDAQVRRRQLSRSARLTTTATVIAAIMPTVLSAQGMVGVGADVIGLPIVFAAGVAAFLELGLVTCGLRARDSVLNGQPGGVDVAATWVLSALSGLFSAAHEVMRATTGAGPGRTWQWEVDPGSLLAAAVRVAAPLVAAWLWHRLLSGARRDSEGRRTTTELRHARRLRALARAALTVRCLTDTHGASPRALRRAHRVLLRRHQAVLRHSRLTPELIHEIHAQLAVCGVADHYPSITRSTPTDLSALLTTPPTMTGHHHPLPGPVSGHLSDHSGHRTPTADTPTGHRTPPADTTTGHSAVTGQVSALVSAPTAPVSGGVRSVSAPLSEVSALVSGGVRQVSADDEVVSAAQPRPDTTGSQSPLHRTPRSDTPPGVRPGVRTDRTPPAEHETPRPDPVSAPLSAEVSAEVSAIRTAPTGTGHHPTVVSAGVRQVSAPLPEVSGGVRSVSGPPSGVSAAVSAPGAGATSTTTTDSAIGHPERTPDTTADSADTTIGHPDRVSAPLSGAVRQVSGPPSGVSGAVSAGAGHREEDQDTDPDEDPDGGLDTDPDGGLGGGLVVPVVPPLEDAVQLVQVHGPAMTGQMMSALLCARGHRGSDGNVLHERTGRRWVTQASAEVRRRQGLASAVRVSEQQRLQVVR